MSARGQRPLLIPPGLRVRMEEVAGLLRKAFDESKVRRHPKGSSKGGQFMAAGQADAETAGITWRDLNVRQRFGKKEYEARLEELRGTVDKMDLSERRQALLEPVVAAAVQRTRGNMHREDFGLPGNLCPVGEFPSNSPYVQLLVESGMSVPEINAILREAQVNALADSDRSAHQALASIEMGRTQRQAGEESGEAWRAAEPGPAIPDEVAYGSASTGAKRTQDRALGKVANVRVYHRDKARFRQFAQRRSAIRFGFIKSGEHFQEVFPEDPGKYWEIEFYGPGAKRQAFQWADDTDQVPQAAVY